MVLQTKVTKLLGITHPIVQGNRETDSTAGRFLTTPLSHVR